MSADPSARAELNERAELELAKIGAVLDELIGGEGAASLEDCGAFDRVGLLLAMQWFTTLRRGCA